ncbi:MAG: acyltransferase [Candidatus Electrothrix sp. GW3-4]|uniref:acyltransferase n=1 Tax=Candidatus Electrothrix sp. GW3-4 TaxID=3126740 RepID=UPI0030D2868F
MKLAQSSSQRIACLRFPLIMGVVFIHGYAATVDFADKTRGMAASHWLSDLIRNILSQHLARIAVPLFFLLSGYLFFWGMQWSWRQYGNKLATRLRSLVLPFLFWNGLTLALLAIAQSLPALNSYFPEKGGAISAYSLYDYLNALFGIERFPVAYQFWFIRDLMIMVLLVPFLQILLRFFPRFALFILFLLWFYPYWPWTIPCATACFFFYAGALLAVSQKDLFAIDLFGHWLPFLYLMVLIADLCLMGTVFHGHLHRIGLLLGLASVLYSTKYIMELPKLKAFLLRAAGWSFWVFAVHEPLLTLTRKTAYYFLQPRSDVLVLALYFLIPVFVVTVSVAAFIVLKMKVPGFLRFLTGGRNSSQLRRC